MLFLLAEGQRGEQEACLAQLAALSLQPITGATLWKRAPRGSVGWKACPTPSGPSAVSSYVGSFRYPSLCGCLTNLQK